MALRPSSESNQESSAGGDTPLLPHHLPPLPSKRSVLATLGALVFALAIMQFVLAIAHESMALGVAHALRSLDVRAVNSGIEQLALGSDAVHTDLALSLIVAVRPRGLAIAGPLGEWLYAAFPVLFASPSLALPSTWISAVFARGSSLPALYLTRSIVEMLLIVIGACLVRAGLKPRARRYLSALAPLNLSWLALFGLYLQAQAILAILRTTPSTVELERMGAGVLVKQVLAVYNPGMYTILSITLSLLIIVCGFGVVPVCAFLLRSAKRAWAVIHARCSAREITPPERSTPRSLPASFQQRLAGFGLMLIVAALLPRSMYAETNIRSIQSRTSAQNVKPQSTIVRKAPPVVEVKALALATATPTARPVSAPTLAPVAVKSPTVSPTPTRRPPSVQRTAPSAIVRVYWSPAFKRYVLTNRDGELFTVRAVNYNTHYTYLPEDEHRRILQRDFKKMRDAGANVITGLATYDETTLTVAEEYGLGVVMPFLPDLNGDYTDPAYREQVKQEMGVYVKRFENYPALLMWNFDDEPIHNMLERLRRPMAQVQAFSDFQFELAEYAYRHDRYHRPSWLKEPRDWNLDIIEATVKQARERAAIPGAYIADPKQYVILARSAYGAPVDIVDWLPKLAYKIEIEMDMPFAVGEYGVVGIAPSERAYHLAEILKEAHRNTRIGSGVYTYGPFQPNPSDPTPPEIAAQLQLVDENAIPIDGAWDKLAEVWQAQQVEQKANRNRSPIPLAAQEFAHAVEQWGGYPASGPIQEGARIKQFFVEGKREGRSLAYQLAWNADSHVVEFMPVESVIFNELGEYTLGGKVLQAYMEEGGYARFGAPTSNFEELRGDGERIKMQEFSRGWRIVVE